MPSSNIAGKRTKRADLASWIERRKPEIIGEAEFAELLHALSPVTGDYLRKLLRESGVPLAPLVEGVRQSTLDELEASLIALLEEYEPAGAGRRAAIRKLVITAKDHARWALRKRPEEGPEKEEMVLWMVTWLENPPVFREWVKIRRGHTGHE